MPGRRRGSNSRGRNRVSRGSISRSRSTVEVPRAESKRLRRSSRLAGEPPAELTSPPDSAPSVLQFEEEPTSNQGFGGSQQTRQPAPLNIFEDPSEKDETTGDLAGGQLEKSAEVPKSKSELDIEWPDTMSVIVNPPSRIRPGEKFGSPLVVSLRAGKEPTNLMTVLSVVAEDGKTMLAPPAPDIITGNMSGSLQILDAQKPAQAKPIHLFRDIRIKKPGKYRLRVSMMEKKNAAQYINIAQVVTDVILVDANVKAQTPGTGAITLQELRNRGLTC